MGNSRKKKNQIDQGSRQTPNPSQNGQAGTTGALPGMSPAEAKHARTHELEMTKLKFEQDRVMAEVAIRMARWGTIKSLGMGIIVACGAVFFGYVTFYLPIQASSGKTTTINVAQNWLAKVDASVYLAWGAAVAMGAGWRLTHKKMVRERGERDKRNIELEKQKDPGRTSSGLLPDGSLAGSEEP